MSGTLTDKSQDIEMKRDKSFLYNIRPRAKMKVKFLSDKRMRKTFMAFLDCKAGYTGDQCVNK